MVALANHSPDSSFCDEIMAEVASGSHDAFIQKALDEFYRGEALDSLPPQRHSNYGIANNSHLSW